MFWEADDSLFEPLPLNGAEEEAFVLPSFLEAEKKTEASIAQTPLNVLQSTSDIGLPDAIDTNLSWVFTRQEQQQLESWWQQAVHLKRGRPSRKSQVGLPTDTRTVLGASGRLRLRLTEWIERYYKMNLREFADLTGFPYSQLLYWNQGRSTPTMARFLALLNWFKEGDIRDFFQIF
ncbi:MAG: hypothetical protein NTW61_08405 [Candidatus Melainabacteria bacterium]|jgi:hypothetical protein|nr:hypothetical protein [Candidatus Melainabacteria bacterium]